MGLRRIVGVLAGIAIGASSVVVSGPSASAQQTGLGGEGFAGDFNGDGKRDVANFDPGNGVWTVGLSNGSRFNFSNWVDYATGDGWVHRIGDFNGDRRDDVFSQKGLRFMVALSTGSAFTLSEWRTLAQSVNWQTFIVGDYNADGREDLAGYNGGNESWLVYLSSGTSFGAGQAWTDPATPAAWSHLGGDFNFDGKSDIASFNPTDTTWRVNLSTGTRFTRSVWEDLGPSSGWGRKRAGDFNGDDRTDVANFFEDREWRIGKSQTDNTFSTTSWATLSPANDWSDAIVGDFNADGKDDIANFRTSEAAWYVSLTSGPTSFQTSVWGDLSPNSGWAEHVGGDFNGDGRGDVASFHPGTGTWWVGISQTSSFALSDWNPPNSAPTADFTFTCQSLTCQFTDASTDGDGRVTSWGWNFGDNTTSAETDPTHTYQSSNDYTVTLTVIDDQGASSQVSKTVSVTEADAAPVAGWTKKCVRLTCTFTDKSTDDGEITIYYWDFGDGSTSSAKNPTHKYAKGDSYTVQHSVTDDASQTDTATKVILVVQPHKRSVGLRLDHFDSDRVYLRARGTLKVGDGFRACKANRNVIIQRRRGSRWVKVARAVTRADGTYRIYPYFNDAPTDRAGVYRALARQEKPANEPGHLCLRAVSGIRNHTH